MLKYWLEKSDSKLYGLGMFIIAWCHSAMSWWGYFAFIFIWVVFSRRLEENYEKISLKNETH
jgi:hypothetical protein